MNIYKISNKELWERNSDRPAGQSESKASQMELDWPHSPKDMGVKTLYIISFRLKNYFVNFNSNCV